ncbi:hypothetical protein ACLESD_04675 [Pyxidicoccus sp. 3LFB2]
MVAPHRFVITFLLLCTLLPGLTRAAPMADQDPASSESVSVPPLIPADPAPESTPAPDFIGEPLDVQGQEVRSGSSIPLPVRGLLEALGAGVTGVVGGFVGLLLVDRLGVCNSEDCLGELLLGALGGATIGVPAGVYSAGRMMGVRGGLGSSYLGLLVGGGGALLGSVLINSSMPNGDGSVVFISVPLAAVLGSIIGFELSEDTTPVVRPGHAPRRDSSPALLLSPTAGTTPRGGFIGGFSGRF